MKQSTIQDPEIVGKAPPKPMPMKVKITTELPAEIELRRIAEILVKLRYSTKKWNQHYGAPNRVSKECWERNADAWIEEHVTLIEQ